MHLIHRPHRRLHKSEKFLAVISFVILFSICIYSIATAPPASNSLQIRDKYYTIVLSEHEFSQLKKIMEIYHKELPGSIQKVQFPKAESLNPIPDDQVSSQAN